MVAENLNAFAGPNALSVLCRTQTYANGAGKEGQAGNLNVQWQFGVTCCMF